MDQHQEENDLLRRDLCDMIGIQIGWEGWADTGC
jgi:hypothetical protein